MAVEFSKSVERRLKDPAVQSKLKEMEEERARRRKLGSAADLKRNANKRGAALDNVMQQINKGRPQ